MKIAIGADHAGFELKRTLAEKLAAAGYELADVGAYAFDAADDYPDFAGAVAEKVRRGEAQRGIVVCGSGVGACVAANKRKGVRACLCHDTYSAPAGRRARRYERALPRRADHRSGPGLGSGRGLFDGASRHRGAAQAAAE